MIISRRRKFVFVHAPKTGGTAVAAAYARHLLDNDIILDDDDVTGGRGHKGPRTRKLNKHSKLADVVQAFGPEAVAEWQLVTTVRNPWARLVSFYTWSRQANEANLLCDLACELEFHEFIRRAEVFFTFRQHDYASYLKTPTGEIPRTCVIRAEAMAAGGAALSRAIGVDIGEIEPRKVSNPDGDYQSFYRNVEDKKIVAAMCIDDIRRFGYTFDGIAPRADQKAVG